jgi:transcriptional regulator with XRE-family HTH domain
MTKLKSQRIAHYLSQKQLAHDAGISQSHLCQIESGKSSASVKTFKAIAQVLNIPINKLI